MWSGLGYYHDAVTYATFASILLEKEFARNFTFIFFKQYLKLKCFDVNHFFAAAVFCSQLLTLSFVAKSEVSKHMNKVPSHEQWGNLTPNYTLTGK